MNWIKKFFRKPVVWTPVEKGPATIRSQRYVVEQIEIQGTYIKERNQNGEERYWITEPDGLTYLKNPSQLKL